MDEFDPTPLVRRLTVTRKALGTAHYWSACATCLEETSHNIDLLAGMVRPWEPRK